MKNKEEIEASGIAISLASVGITAGIAVAAATSVAVLPAVLIGAAVISGVAGLILIFKKD